MKRNSPIVPRPDLGRTDAGGVNAALQRDRYKASLTQELGIDMAARTAATPRPPGTISGGTVFVAIVAALITFLLILGIMMWRDGTLPRLWPDRGFTFAPNGPTTDWIMPDKTSGRAVEREAAPEAPVDAKAEYDAANPKPPPADDAQE